MERFGESITEVETGTAEGLVACGRVFKFRRMIKALEVQRAWVGESY